MSYGKQEFIFLIFILRISRKENHRKNTESFFFVLDIFFSSSACTFISFLCLRLKLEGDS